MLGKEEEEIDGCEEEEEGVKRAKKRSGFETWIVFGSGCCCCCCWVDGKAKAEVKNCKWDGS